MKLKIALIALAIAAMTVASAPASWANSLTFQGVTFNLTATGWQHSSAEHTQCRSTASPDWADASIISGLSD